MSDLIIPVAVLSFMVWWHGCDIVLALRRIAKALEKIAEASK